MAIINNQFPAESDLGTVTIHGDFITSRGNESIYDAEVDLNLLSYAYITIDHSGQSSLFLFDHTQHWIPTHFIGFRKMFVELSSRFQLDEDVFFQYLNCKKEAKKEIWRKKTGPNYQILTNVEFRDYHRGFEIQASKKNFIDWDTKNKDLMGNENLYYVNSPYDQLMTKFKFPVRVGNIFFNELSAFPDERDDAPILHFYAECFNADSSDGSYYEIRDQLIRDFPAKDQELIYEREDQKFYSFNANGMTISIIYTYDSEYGFDGGYTSFEIKNEREYPELLIGEEYEANGHVTAFLLIDERIESSSNYKFNSNIKRKFSTLQQSSIHHPIVWTDGINDKIGFADRKHYQIFKKSEIANITIQNILPAKGGGGGYLEINFIDDRSYTTIFSGKCNVFDKYAEQIALLTGKEVVIAEELYDC